MIRLIRFVGLIVLLMVSFVFANKDCKYIEIIDDGFGKIEKGLVYPRCSLLINDKQVFYKETFFTEGSILETLQAGTPLLLSLENGTIIRLMTQHDAVPIRTASGGTVYTEWSVSCVVSKNDLTLLGSSLLKGRKITVANNDVVKGSGGKIFSKKLMSVAKCFLREIE